MIEKWMHEPANYIPYTEQHNGTPGLTKLEWMAGQVASNMRLTDYSTAENFGHDAVQAAAGALKACREAEKSNERSEDGPIPAVDD